MATTERSGRVRRLDLAKLFVNADTQATIV